MSSNDQPACPVDHKARDAWLKAAEQQQQQTQAQPQPPAVSSEPSSAPLSGGCDSSQIDSNPSIPPSSLRPKFANSRLSTDRQVSSIPRASPPPSTSPEQASPNAQTARPVTSTEGRWVYPSESQFHAALLRKHGAGSAPPANSIPPIIPIHNAVNERTWHEILTWERGRGGERCGGPKLVSFSGDSSKLTPRARMYSMMGYTAPFDRHDWVVERCGTRVEYVIDFYAGKNTGANTNGKPLSFYLDVRPKLNSFEGWKMRAQRFVGW